MQTRRYLTTPLYYVNARPHLGHFYTTMLVDVVKRHWAQRGDQVTFLTGTDEHGEKIEQMAKAEGKAPKAFADEIAADFEATWKKLGIDFDIFYRTTAPDHARRVQHALTFLKEKGDIEFREYKGSYCVGCERFLTESELTPDGLCPDHLKKPEYREESNYFFLMSRYQARLIEHIEKNPSFIQPEHFRNEALSFLKQPLQDLCISRPKTRLSWGIELPFDTKYVTYVWFDALLNYLNAMKWPDAGFDKALWSTATHFTAKDILKPHGIYWPTMLMALGVPLYQGLRVSGYWLMGGTKMSKSLGNVVRPHELEEKYGRDTLRFYLIREMSYGIDATFTLESFVNSVNAHLANGIGNLVSRVFTLCQKNFKGHLDPAKLNDADRAVLHQRAVALTEWDAGFDHLKFQNSAKAWTDLVTQTDLYVNATKPWALAKEAANDPAQAERLQTVLGVCLKMIQALGVMIYPVLPHASEEICEALGLGRAAAKDIREFMKEHSQYALSSNVPKLFMRVQLPEIPV
jgi:methionyl-tRNA synthetase